jgi:repressor LexA
MDEQNKNIRPTKKQRELLTFIETFIAENGYSPSYREIMTGCNYTSVATVSLHVNNLIKRGHLVKREHNARSLEVVHMNDAEVAETPQLDDLGDRLVAKIELQFLRAEQQEADALSSDDLEVLVESLRLLGYGEHAEKLAPRLEVLQPDSAEHAKEYTNA